MNSNGPPEFDECRKVVGGDANLTAQSMNDQIAISNPPTDRTCRCFAVFSHIGDGK
jgi:hypothetical protein